MNNFSTAVEILAADGTSLPEEIEVLQPVSIKDAPNHPNFEVTESDLDEYAANFKNSIRKGVPIDIEHRKSAKFGEQAAGWIKDVYTTTKENGKKALMAKVEWNSLGKELVGDQRFKFLSPEFVPKSLSEYSDPEGKGKFTNVLKAVTLTNMPLFKGLKALTASEGESTSGLTHRLMEHIILAEEKGKGATMDLSAIRAKAASELNEDEKKFLADHKAELSAEEQTKFGLAEAKPEETPEVKPEEKPAEAVAATEVTVSAKEFGEMKAQIEALTIAANEGAEARKMLAQKEAEEFVAIHVKRGVIKAGEAENTAKKLLEASADSRKSMQELIESLPDRVVTAGEIGENNKGDIDNAGAALDVKVKEIMASEDGKALTYGEAMKQAIKNNPELSKEYQEGAK